MKMKILKKLYLRSGNISSNDSLNPAFTDTKSQKKSSRWKLFMCEARFFDYEAEMTFKFGRQSASKKLPARRKFVTVEAKRNWPSLKGNSISMQMLNSVQDEDAPLFFKVSHSAEYQEIQSSFFAASATHSPEAISNILAHHPYHLDSLLILSDVCKFGGDLEMSCDLVERCCFIVESKWHALFNPSKGNCRLPFVYFENRAYFFALHRHMMALARRGCVRSALEFCKFLLSLDPQVDPLFSVSMIDFLALRCEMWQFVIDFYSKFKNNFNLTFLPNWSFNIALCHFKLEKIEEAKKLLLKAIVKFPSCFSSFCEKIELNNSHPWLINHLSAVKNSSESALQSIESLFIERNYLLWKNGEVLAWIKSSLGDLNSFLGSNEKLSMEWQKKRKSDYSPLADNAKRHILLSDLQRQVPFPRDESNSKMNMYDPYPPQDTISPYILHEDSSASSLVMSFLRTIAPWSS